MYYFEQQMLLYKWLLQGHTRVLTSSIFEAMYSIAVATWAVAPSGSPGANAIPPILDPAPHH